MPNGTHPRAALSDSDFIKAFKTYGPEKLAKKLGQNRRAVYFRRERLENKFKVAITGRGYRSDSVRPSNHPHRLHLDVQDGCVLVGSDAHIWPGPMTTAMRGFIKFAKECKPKAVILNGDVMDFPGISKHDPIGWEDWPSVQDEIEAAQEILHEIEKAAGRVRKIWTLGNHDARFEKKLAISAPEYARVNGLHLKDHFPLWEACWSSWINNRVVIKHRYSGGIGAVRSNAMKSGMSMVTGHLHSLKVTPLTDYTGTRYGVDSGCLAEPSQRAFVNYTEDAPLDWRSGFVVLTFIDGRMLFPELAQVFDENHIEFRGSVIKV